MSVKRSSSESIAVRLKPYRHMKDSGIEWLGVVPVHWECPRLKNICRLAYGDSLSDDMRKPGGVEVYGSNGVVGQHHTANTIGPCIIIGRKGSFGKANYSTEPAFAIDTTFFVDRRHTSADFRWLYYVLGWMRLDEITKDSAIPGLDREDAYRRIAPLPPPAEQTAIARFLAHATGRIERYIRAKEKLIALLEEQKRVIVHDAITGRIDVRTGKPYPAYKPSGVDWLSDVPVHWETRRLGRIGRFFKGSGGTKADEVADGVPCIRYGDLYTQHQFFISSSRSCVSRELAETAYTPINYGDVLFAGSGETMDEIGKSAVNLIRPPAYCGGDVIVFRPSIDIDARFFGYATDCPAAVRQKAQMGRGFTVMHIYSSELGRVNTK